MLFRVTLVLVLSALLLMQGAIFGNQIQAEKTPDFGLQRSQEVHETEQGVVLDSRTKITVSTLNGFNSPIDIVVTVDPKDSGVDTRINGKTSLKIDPKKDTMNLTVDAAHDAPTGDYKVTITGTSTVNGQKVIRTTFFIIKVKPPSEFFIEANPPVITIPQGGTGSTTVKTTATKSFQNPINLRAWAHSSGFSSKFSGDGKSTMDIMAQSFTNWFVEPKQNKPTNTRLEIKVDPQVPSGTYKMTIEAIMQNVQFAAPDHRIPLTIHVTANPEFAQIQDPTPFDIEFEHYTVTLEPRSTFYNDIKIWSERPDDAMQFTVSVSPANKGVLANINEKMITPKELPALGVFVIAAVSQSAEPGTYTVTLTGKTTTLYGKKLTQITSFEITVPNKKTLIPDPIGSGHTIIQKNLAKLSDTDNTKKKKEKTESAESTQLKNELKEIYQISKFGEKFTSVLKKANDGEAKALKKMSGDAKSIYSKTKNSDAKKLGDKIQVQLKDVEQDKKQISVLGDESKKITKQILSVAKENKITKTDLDKPVKDSKKPDPKNTKPQASLDQYYDPNAVGFGGFYGDLDELARVLFDAQTERSILETHFSKQFLDKITKELEAKKQNEKDSDAPPESLLDDLDPTIRGPDVNDIKEKPDPKNTKPKNSDQKDPDAPPESILDDIDTNYGADIGPKPESKQDQKPKQKSGIDHARIAQDDMKIIEESLRQELLDQIRDIQMQIDLERQLRDLKQKIVIIDPKKPVIQKDPVKIPTTKTEVKPKSTQPEKTEKPIIQKDPTISEPKPSNTKPTLSIPKQVTQEATGPSGANVAFSASSQDKEDGSLTPACTPSSGSMFPIGATAVSCTVTDSNNNSVSGSFIITVRDTTPPAFAPFQPTEGVRDDTGVQVFFDVTANDLVDGNVPVSCNYQSGYKFPPGVTDLQCTASDSRGNQSTKTVQITVTVTESGQ